MRILYLFLFPLVLFSGSLTDASSADDYATGIAEFVNGEPITFPDINQIAAAPLANLRKTCQGAELQEKTRALKTKTLDDLIDRKLIILEFHRLGGWTPPSYIDTQLQDVIKTQYHGDESQLQRELDRSGETMEEYRTKIEENAIVIYMIGQYVEKKLTSTTPAKKDQERARIRKTWIESLRKSAILQSMT